MLLFDWTIRMLLGRVRLRDKDESRMKNGFSLVIFVDQPAKAQRGGRGMAGRRRANACQACSAACLVQSLES